MFTISDVYLEGLIAFVCGCAVTAIFFLVRRHRRTVELQAQLRWVEEELELHTQKRASNGRFVKGAK